VVKQTVVCVSLIVLSCAFLTPTVSAQESSGIAGVVRDAQGAVMPGVTVETHDRILCELRDDGEAGGVEAQFFRNETFEIGRRFFPYMDLTRTPRAMATAWAEEWRKAIETDGW
jgi:hypothetical protein